MLEGSDLFVVGKQNFTNDKSMRNLRNIGYLLMMRGTVARVLNFWANFFFLFFFFKKHDAALL